MLINGYHVRVINAATGDLVPNLTINTKCHGTDKPTGAKTGPEKPKRANPK